MSFKPVRIGEDAVALIVSKDVWEDGVRTLTKERARDIYEGRVTNWSQLGGPDRGIAFFNNEPGRGTWEVFVHWLYGDAKKAPPVTFPEVAGNEETRNKVASTRGALSPLSASWADGREVFALGLELEDGSVVQPTLDNIATRKYPMRRALFLLSSSEPTDELKGFMEFLLSQPGQELVRQHGYLSLDQLKH